MSPTQANTIDSAQRQRAATERRCWIRLTRCCNNHCRFCHDADAQTGEIRDSVILRAEIAAGLRAEASRLVLSGGEPTLHPDFFALLRFAREKGYDWIQVVTNGRMFAYPGFASRAAGAGLDEATFSMHAADSQLHDQLVGVRGAFAQSLRGIENLQRSGRVVVNLDVVICALNLRTLPEMIDFFADKGIGEFDLLWPVPFGWAWQNREEVYPDRRLSAQFLAQAILRARRRGLVVWTNRVPAPLLEGFEETIQDPYKLHDEVSGRRDEFVALLEGGQRLVCWERERCKLCFLLDFCIELQHRQRSLTLRQPIPVRLELDRPTKVDAELAARALRMRWLSCDLRRAIDFAERWEGSTCETVLELLQPPRIDPQRISSGTRLRLVRVASAEPAVLDALLQFPQGQIEVILNQETTRWLSRNLAAVRTRPGRFWFALQRFLTCSELEQAGVDPAAALAPLSGSAVCLVNLPPCVLPGAVPVREPDELPTTAINPGGSINLEAFTSHFILNGYRVHSLRCRDCSSLQLCPGLPINHVRRFGLRILRPEVT